MLAFWVNYGSILHIHGAAVYIVPLALQALPAILLVGCMTFNNESPRFLAKVDRWEDATKALCRVRQLPADHEYLRSELKDISDQLEHERMLIGGSSTKDLLKEMFTIPGNRKRVLISIGLMVCQQMTGTNAINYYAPQIFTNIGITGNTNRLFATGIYGVVKMTTCAAFLLFAADSLGRRRSLLWTSIAQGTAMMYIGLYVRISPPIPNEPIPPAGYMALVCIFLFAGFFQWGWGPVCWIYVSEIPTARLRSLNVAIAAATQWLFNFVVARATPNMLVTVGSHGYGYVDLYVFSAATYVIANTLAVPSSSTHLSATLCSSSSGSSSPKPKVSHLRRWTTCLASRSLLSISRRTARLTVALRRLVSMARRSAGKRGARSLLRRFNSCSGIGGKIF